MRPECGEQIRDVVPDGRAAQPELARDLAGRLSLSEQVQNLQLSLRQQDDVFAQTTPSFTLVGEPSEVSPNRWNTAHFHTLPTRISDGLDPNGSSPVQRVATRDKATIDAYASIALSRARRSTRR